MNQPSPSLDTCAHEPIHIPGSIQPHGALLAFDGGLRLVAWSANTLALLGVEPALGNTPETFGFKADIIASLHEAAQLMGTDETAPMVLELERNHVTFDVVIHAHLNRIIVEFESRNLSADEAASFARKAHRTIDRLKRQKNIEILLQTAVEEIQKLTGFDRVMAYIFRYDDSGDVVAEKCRADLDPYVGRRYPASDIPAQARRLYVLNTLRLIADVNYQPAPLIGLGDTEALDMSHCILRSVSPIHIEYLHNLGVQASMSVSIIVNGRLWGMIACHHMSTLQIPYSIRMACDVIAQIMASNVSSIQDRERAELNEQVADIRASFTDTLLNEDDVLRALSVHANALKTTLAADALVIAQQGKLMAFGDLDKDLASDILALLPTTGDDLIAWHTRREWPHALQARIGTWVGLLALRFDAVLGGWILALRLEQIETVRWGGRPEKEVTPGPMGPRLTPRGSFAEWKEIVRDSAEPWDNTRLEAARDLLTSLLRISSMRHAEIDRARRQLMAILGHDLRDPLNTIHVAAHLIKEGSSQGKMTEIIRNSSSRMERLIAQVLDMSRLESGIGLGINPSENDVTGMLGTLIDEAKIAHPGVEYKVDMPVSLHWQVDIDRLAQAANNLLSNARHHGNPNSNITLAARCDANHLCIEVSNEANAIDPDTLAGLFSPFKRSSSTTRRAGLGLGLYIAKEIIEGHKGKLTYHYQAPYVTFRMTLPINTRDD